GIAASARSMVNSIPRPTPAVCTIPVLHSNTSRRGAASGVSKKPPRVSSLGRRPPSLGPGPKVDAPTSAEVGLVFDPGQQGVDLLTDRFALIGQGACLLGDLLEAFLLTGQGADEAGAELLLVAPVAQGLQVLPDAGLLQPDLVAFLGQA